ncbi:hypothetical protein ACQEVC_18145 [Plantactinospora sp. CA-294935]|uniref:hypothetical protein n=1 Tax=Plantactinospora sp. CA-294935 TaxID=3240012 RepID=UPI003D93B564
MVPFIGAAITVSASVKVCYWAVDRRVRRIEESRCQEMEELRDQREIELEEIRELRSEVRALREAVLKREGDHVATETLTAAEKFLNERGASVAHLPRVRPGSLAGAGGRRIALVSAPAWRRCT